MQIKTLGSYEILREWGRNGLGRLFRARDPRSGAEVTIQLVETLSGLDPDARAEAVDRLRSSCRRIAGQRHPNLVAVLDGGEAEGMPYVVTEPVEGIPFEVHCRPDALLPASTVLDLVAGVARGLDELHRAGVVHGGVRPTELLRVQDTGMVTGAGLASCQPQATGVEISAAPHYLSPEQIRDETLDGRSDLFALGSVLYEMLTGQKAFPGESTATVLYRIVNEPVRDPGELDPPVYAAVTEVLRRTLAQQRDDRFPSGASLADALQEASVAVRVDESIAPETLPARAEGADASAVGTQTSPPAPRAPSRTSLRPFVLGASLVLVAAIAVFATLHDWDNGKDATVPWLEARVRTEPPGLEVQLDGEPLILGDAGAFRFRGEPPFGRLSARHACRSAEHALSPAEAGTDLVLVMDPIETEIAVDPSLDGVRVLLNGEAVGTTPTTVVLDLCRSNGLELQAEGYRGATVEIPAGAQPLEARKQVLAMALEPIPKGRLVLPVRRGLQLVFYVDGKRIGRSTRELELEEGEHDLRFKNEYHWIDVTTKVRIRGGEATTPSFDPRFATLVVQAFPSNCKVYVRRPGGTWRYLDETPAERRVAAGRYEVKVQLNPTGEARVSTVDLKEGVNPPLRVAFGGGR